MKNQPINAIASDFEISMKQFSAREKYVNIGETPILIKFIYKMRAYFVKSKKNWTISIHQDSFIEKMSFRDDL